MMNSWDAETYARNFNFVPQYGRELIAILAPQEGEEILDLGCGTGMLTAEIAARGCRVVGIDRDAGMIALAKKAHPGLSFVQQDAENITISGPFDGIFSNAALHWMDVGRVFPQLAKVLRPGGRLAAEMGGVHSVAAIERAIYKSLEKLGFSK
jgi:trans-aconitate methyltransferase